MLRLTFYTGCILNDKYQNVISTALATGQNNQRLIDVYLNSLSHNTIELDTVYYENEGEIILEFNQLEYPYNYNYMKAEVINENQVIILTRYCFITKIQLKNGCCYVSYKEDIFSSYSQRITNTQDCALVSSRLCRYKENSLIFNYRKLPVEYEGNNLLNFTFENATDSEVQIIVELQLYDLVNPSAGVGSETDNRVSFLCVLYDVERTEGTDHKSKRFFKRDEVQPVLEDFLKWVSAPNPHISNIFPGETSTGAKYFDVGNIILLPKGFAISTFFNLLDYSFDNADWLFYYNFYHNAYPRYALQKLKDEYSYQKNNLAYHTLTANYKMYSFGTYSTQVKLEQNGSNIPYRFSIIYGQSNFNIILSIQNKEIDVTNDFLYTLHYDLISSEQNSQRKIALQLKNNSIQTEKEKMDAGTIRGFFQALSGIGETIAGGESGSSNMLFKGIQDTGFGIINAAESLSVKTKLEQASVLNNKPRYATSKGNFTHQLVNANYFYLYSYSLIYPDNESFVKATVNNLGFNVFKYVGVSSEFSLSEILNNKLNAERLNAYYDYIKLQNPNVYGQFTNEIAIKLNEILSSGIKIWYDINHLFEDDGYIDNIV